MDASMSLPLEQRYPEVFRRASLRGLLPLWIVLGVIAYIIYAVWFFQLPTVLANAKWERLGSYLAQWVTYDATAEYRLDGETIQPKWPRFFVLGDNPKPDWILHHADGAVEIDLGATQYVRFTQSAATLVNGADQVEIDIAGDTPTVTSGELPAWAAIKGDEVVGNYGFAGELRVGTDRVKFRKRFIGWANFVFDTDS